MAGAVPGGVSPCRAIAQYYDDFHMTQAGNDAVAKLYTEKLAAALGRLPAKQDAACGGTDAETLELAAHGWP
ncbi:hypothetical protein OL239_10965 [Arthrobacter sp. ATA002]|uniref:hypothetical protein n=1 Tax=Arthrobacter sp. ATA002 TaxID=2991715 RepID=UPI0022A6A28F|nr:hypothetical protein [Arthrobacter sp. ATA002]WAP50560.1 hypothetical protein OL239_10965 [Arthrobacter sp. ATA002]